MIPRPSFSVTIGRALGVVVVTVHGTLDASGCRHLEHVLEDLIDNQGNLKVVVDLLDVARVDELGLAVFDGAAALATRRGGELILSDPSDVLTQALEANGLAPVVSITGRSAPFPGRGTPSAGRATPAAGNSNSAHPAGTNRYLGDLEGGTR